jgi:hypothetical protein
MQLIYGDVEGNTPPDIQVLLNWEADFMGGAKLTGGILDWANISYLWEGGGIPKTAVIETSEMKIVAFARTVNIEEELEKLGIGPI